MQVFGPSWPGYSVWSFAHIRKCFASSESPAGFKLGVALGGSMLQQQCPAAMMDPTIVTNACLSSWLPILEASLRIWNINMFMLQVNAVADASRWSGCDVWKQDAVVQSQLPNVDLQCEVLEQIIPSG